MAQLHDRYIYDDDDDTDAAFKILTFGNICFVRSRKTSISVGVVCERERESEQFWSTVLEEASISIEQ